MESTGLDGFIVARGAVGNPWIFRDLRCVWENQPVPSAPDLAEQRQIMLEHFHSILQYYPEVKAVRRFRKFIVGYTRRHPMRKAALLSLVKLKTRSEVEAAIDTWYADFEVD